MKARHILSLVSLTFTSLISQAIIANPEPVTVFQPDGTGIELTLHGDEFLDYTTTADGFTVVKDIDGYYHYAQLNSSGKLIASSQKAHNAEYRSTEEISFLSNVSKNIHQAMTPQAIYNRDILHRMTSAPQRLSGGHFDYSKFRGLVILVEYNDCPFLRSDIHDVIDDMVNKHDYKGYMSNAMIPELIPYTGSVRDYFYDNSFGAFDPKFDVVGPIKIDYSKYDMKKSTNAQVIIPAVIEAADSLIDYSVYDTDGNREVDMVYFIFSGSGSNFSGNDSRLVWPHASQVYNSSYYDGVKFGRYACSTELYGREESTTLDGIGTMCHEFSHVLGLPDEYDTDYSSSGGQSVHPAKWSVMASGSYLNSSRTPCGYSLYERYSAGFITPKDITDEGSFTLEPLNVSNTGYRINSATKDEYFLLENRQKTGWDAYLPGHGMLVFRVDSTDVKVWESNDINVNPAHNYYELIRATPTHSSSSSTTVTDSQGDPFPGSGKVTALNNFTSPNFRSWKGIATPIILSKISESSDGIISFSTELESIDSDFEDFESINAFSNDTTDVQGSFCKWDFTKCNVVALGGEEESSESNHAVAMVKGSELVSSTLAKSIQNITVKYINPNSTPAIIRSYYSTDQGTNWTALKTLEGTENPSIAAGDTVTLQYTSIIPKNSQLKFTQFTGSKSSAGYLDDICLTYEKSSSGIADIILSAETLNAKILSGNALQLSGLTTGKPIDIVTIAGTTVYHATAPDSSMTIELPLRGIYIVRHCDNTIKVAL
jgi:M6 family metalloprotease-like protein